MICEYNVKEYCCEDLSLIENYEKAINDTEQMWECHHRLETKLGMSKRELIENKLYYDRPASELIFLTFSEHRHVHKFGTYKSKEHRKSLSKSLKNKPKSHEHRKKLSEAKIGRPQPNVSLALKGRKSTFKGHKHSEESKIKMSKAKIGKPCPTKGKHKVWNDESHTSFHFE